MNAAATAVRVDDYTVEVDGTRGMKLKVGGKETTVLELLKADMKAVKWAKSDAEGKMQINTKAEQKVMLGGRSPDFSDGASMRVFSSSSQSCRKGLCVGLTDKRL